MDGAQLYWNKESDTWFGIATLIDFAPEIHHAKEMVLPTFVIRGPNAPKHYDSFFSQHSPTSLLAKNLSYQFGMLQHKHHSLHVLGSVLELQTQ